VTLDQHLPWAPHATNVTHRFRQRVNLLSYMSSKLSPFAIRQLYKTYVRSVAEYCSPIWAFGISRETISTLERLQACVCRRYLQRKGAAIKWDTPKEIIFEQCKLESLLWRRQIACLVEIHRFVHLFPDLLSKFGYSLSNSSRRPYTILLPSKCGVLSSKLFLFKVSPIWNDLPTPLRTIYSRVVFRRELCRYFASFGYLKSGIPAFHMSFT